ncbi:hypothetical protein C8Q80DRAFT_1265133 [Daedaleopsis nitida]|nr:hypothetical protein C8Q80DRAFT_1265133 [Daedaleopsis nitida]
MDITVFPDTESPMVVTTSLGVQVLDYDVLMLVMTFAGNPTVAAMMRTCNTLYLSGAKILLDNRRGVVRVDHAHILSSCCFMLAELGFRFPLLQALNLSGASLVDEKAAGLLLWTLPKLTSLADLTVEYAEDLLQSNPELHKGFAHLLSVRNLKVTEAGKLTCRMLRRMRSQIISLRIDYLFDDDFTPFLETLKRTQLPD